MMSKVLNKRTDVIPPDAVYVGRPTKWGKPFKVNDPLLPHGISKAEKHRLVVEEYQKYIMATPHLMDADQTLSHCLEGNRPRAKAFRDMIESG